MPIKTRSDCVSALREADEVSELRKASGMDENTVPNLQD